VVSRWTRGEDTAALQEPWWSPGGPEERTLLLYRSPGGLQVDQELHLMDEETKAGGGNTSCVATEIPEDGMLPVV